MQSMEHGEVSVPLKVKDANVMMITETSYRPASAKKRWAFIGGNITDFTVKRNNNKKRGNMKKLVSIITIALIASSGVCLGYWWGEVYTTSSSQAQQSDAQKANQSATSNVNSKKSAQGTSSAQSWKGESAQGGWRSRGWISK